MNDFFFFFLIDSTLGIGDGRDKFFVEVSLSFPLKIILSSEMSAVSDSTRIGASASKLTPLPESNRDLALCAEHVVDAAIIKKAIR